MSAHSGPGVPGTITTDRRRRSFALAGAIALALLAAACGDSNDTTDAASDTTAAGPSTTPSTISSEPFVISAIPDQDPEQLQRIYGTVARYLTKATGVPVEFKPVTDYTASVSLFKVGDLDMVWFGGLTGVQARLQTPGAQAILQRDIDQDFHSVFIANTATKLGPVTELAGLSALAGRRFSFGSESSTSGRLMPEYFLNQAGVETGQFNGPPGFSGNHDKTIELVTAGTYEAGVLNEQVWQSRLAEGKVDQTKVKAIFTTPGYHDYHWLLRPDVAERYGPDFPAKLTRAFVQADPADPDVKTILELFKTKGFVPTDNNQYAEIEKIGRKLGLIT
ncbi:MAG: putative selenate ABC transporter substrate-binding protein [Acidimicrobiales bacterium]